MALHMYQNIYNDIANNSPLNYRKIEREAILRSIRDLEHGLQSGPGSVETIKACIVIQQIWTLFISDVMNDSNQLPVELRARIISIGLWIQRELAEIVSGRSTNFSGLTEILSIIADGLV